MTKSNKSLSVFLFKKFKKISSFRICMREKVAYRIKIEMKVLRMTT